MSMMLDCYYVYKHACGLQRGEYGEAFELTSNNRVDLNVIVDYAWPAFLTHAGDFVKEVQVSLPPLCLPHTLAPK